MADRPIIFSGPMVRALLDGRKTQTRRLATSPLHRCKVGDRLYVRESFTIVPATAYRHSEGVVQTVNPGDPDDAAIYMLGWDRSIPKWRPSIRMPRWASRLTLIVEEVRFQRLQEISEADAIAEGIEDVTANVASRDPALRFWRRYRDGGWNSYVDSPIASYASLWTELHGQGSWEENPEIVALTFRVIRENIDRIAA